VSGARTASADDETIHSLFADADGAGITPTLSVRSWAIRVSYS